MNSNPGFFDRTLANLRSAWRSIARSDAKLELSADLPEGELEALRECIRACLAGKGGEVSARGRAAELGEAYLGLSDTGKLNFFNLLVDEFSIDQSALQAALTAHVECTTQDERLAGESRLRSLLTPAYLRLLTQFNALPQGVKFLVDLRADLLRLRGDDARLTALDEQLCQRLESWFDIGFLELRRITWEAPAALLERLIHYEAVHAVSSWDDLKNRLAADRRCFAFFHPNMPDEPLIFVWVALLPEMAGSVQALLERGESPAQEAQTATTAIFYSISNTQVGLQGVSLGNFLIKRVVNALRAELPQLKTFATLSPIPGFARWLQAALDEDDSLLDGDSRELLASDGWADDAERAAQLEKVLKPLCARYLVSEKRGQRARDPVAHFHLSNGALIERINWLGDRSAKGMANAHGLMVNYLYELDEIDRHHERYSESFTVGTSREVRALADKG